MNPEPKTTLRSSKPATVTIAIDEGRVANHIRELADIGAYGKTGVWRTAYSTEWREAQRLVARWCEEAGLETRQDAVGNVWGTLRGTQDGPAIVSGSHIDSQTPGGQYDGALGVIAAIVALRSLREQVGAPTRTLQAVSLVEEEASRFPAANMWGSRAITGQIAPEATETVRGLDGETIGEAMRAAGLDPKRVHEAKRTDIDAFLELHIEQGPSLEDAGVPVGIVTAITGLRHYFVELRGRSDHAGARPMDRRLDPMDGAAEIISGVIAMAREMGAPAVTTVGQISAEPNLPVAVPDTVKFTIDTRHPDPRARDELYARQEAFMAEVANRRGLTANWKITLDIEPCLSDSGLVDILSDAAREQEIDALKMHSGAGHDTQRMATIAKVGMVFVLSRDGRSHTPEEFTSVADAVAGIRVLTGALQRLGYG
jgi:allantoate deiminase